MLSNLSSENIFWNDETDFMRRKSYYPEEEGEDRNVDHYLEKNYILCLLKKYALSWHNIMPPDKFIILSNKSIYIIVL